MTVRLHLDDMSLLSTQVRIADIILGEKPVVRLEGTIFHVQGGGQKADRGILGPSRVLQVVANGPWIDHYVDNVAGLEIGALINAEVDAAHRYINSLFHSCTHHVVNVVEEMYPQLRVANGHSWPGEARAEFDGRLAIESIDVVAINARLMAEIAQGLAVKQLSRHSDARSFAIGHHTPIACGGTHIHSLSEVRSCHIAAVKRKGERVRVSFNCTSAQ